MPVTIIAEAGVNHNGDLETAKRMAYVAKECGADIVKYQTAVPELVVSRFADAGGKQRRGVQLAPHERGVDAQRLDEGVLRSADGFFLRRGRCASASRAA